MLYYLRQEVIGDQAERILEGADSRSVIAPSYHILGCQSKGDAIFLFLDFNLVFFVRFCLMASQFRKLLLIIIWLKVSQCSSAGAKAGCAAHLHRSRDLILTALSLLPRSVPLSHCTFLGISPSRCLCSTVEPAIGSHPPLITLSPRCECIYNLEHMHFMLISPTPSPPIFPSPRPVATVTDPVCVYVYFCVYLFVCLCTPDVSIRGAIMPTYARGI